MKKIKEIIDSDHFLPKKILKDFNKQINKEHDDCSKCDNTECKCHQIMDNLAECINLSDQIGHIEVYNITLTLLTVLQNISTHENELIEIMNVCQQVFKKLRPKEMGQLLN